MDYASVTKPKKTLNSEQVIELLTDLFSVLSTSDDPKYMLMATIKFFITLFANQQWFQIKKLYIGTQTALQKELMNLAHSFLLTNPTSYY